MPFKRLSLTEYVLPIKRNASSATVSKALTQKALLPNGKRLLLERDKLHVSDAPSLMTLNASRSWFTKRQFHLESDKSLKRAKSLSNLVHSKKKKK